jgi:dipeptidyl-peptidase-4
MPTASRLLFSLLLASVISTPAMFAQQNHSQTLTDQDYHQAERWMSYNVNPLVQHTIAGIAYLPDGRVFYRDPTSAYTSYMLADPTNGTTTAAFDTNKLSAALSAATKKKLDVLHLGILSFTPGTTSGFNVITLNGTFDCDITVTTCTPVKTDVPNAPRGRRARATLNISPDKTLAAFIRDNNLWVRTLATGAERQLTFDGAPDFGYATDDAGWSHSDAAILTWSADSSHIATFQQDMRKTGMMYLVPVTNRHPVLEAWHYPLVGDPDVTMIEPVVIDVAAGKVVRLKTAPLQHRSMECDDVSCNGNSEWTDVEFSPDNKHLAYVSTSRDHKDEDIFVADTATGDIRPVFHDHVDTYYGWQSKTDWKYLPNSNEFLWVSEKSNYAQIYLYDLTTGKLKNQITHGDGPVSDILRVDEKNRVIYFTATGKEKGVDPYYDNFYRVEFDGKDQKLLTPDIANHVITVAPNAATFVDVYSTVDTPQTAVLRDNNGKLIATLTHQDISQLLAAGWHPPTAFSVKSRDPKTLVYGFLWKPTYFDPSQQYPVVDYIYPGPQESSCGSRSFSAAHGDNQAVADLGFIVVCIDGMGNPHRTKAFHDAHASKPEDMGDDTVPDQVAGITDLASRSPWMDISRVGIWGHSGGGNATVSAMFHAPDFFKVGWSESGNHDNRDYEDDWDERWAGLEVVTDGKSNYEPHANQNYAANLKGHLMLVHGTMDDNVPPANTLLVVDALLNANKDFDLLMIPNAHHGYGTATPYVMRRRWDYFVRYLAGKTPPFEYKMTSFEDIQRRATAPNN